MILEGKLEQELVQKFNDFNAKYFDGELPQVPIYVKTLKSVGGKALCKVRASPEVVGQSKTARRLNKYKGWNVVPGSMKIVISNLFKRDSEGFDVILIHEMIHILMYVRGMFHVKHDEEWLDKAREIEKLSGLKIPRTDKTSELQLFNAPGKNVGVLLIQQPNRSPLYAIISGKVVEQNPDMIMNMAKRRFIYSDGTAADDVDIKLYLASSPTWHTEAAKLPVQNGRGKDIKLWYMNERVPNRDALLAELGKQVREWSSKKVNAIMKGIDHVLANPPPMESIDDLLGDILTELHLPRKSTERHGGVDYIHMRKMQRQDQMESKFVLKFFEILDRYMPERANEIRFIDRFHKYITHDKTRTDISLTEIMQFVRLLGSHEQFDKIGRITGIKSQKRILELKDEMWQFLASVKRIMRGTSSDATHSGVSHPLQIHQRFDAMRIRNIKNRFRFRQTKRQLAGLDPQVIS